MSLCTLEHYEIDVHMDSVKNIHVLKVRKSDFPNVYNILIGIVRPSRADRILVEKNPTRPVLNLFDHN